MFSNFILKIIVIVQICLVIQIVGFKYIFLVQDETIFSPCYNMPETSYIDKFFDISNMNFRYLENGSVYFNGYTVLTEDIGKEVNPASIQIFKKNRDTWVSTVYNINRNDLCKHLFDSTELWYLYTKKVPKEEQTCPLVKGSKFYFDVISDMEMELTDPSVAGEYKIQSMIQWKGINKVLCVNVLIEVYRK